LILNCCQPALGIEAASFFAKKDKAESPAAASKMRLAFYEPVNVKIKNKKKALDNQSNALKNTNKLNNNLSLN